MELSRESKKHFINKMRRKEHLANEHDYMNNLPDMSVSLDCESSTASETSSMFSEQSIPIQFNFDDFEFDSNDDETLNSNQNQIALSEPKFCDYAEVCLSAILSHANLTLNSANRVVNIFNNLTARFSQQKIKLPNARSFWVIQVKDSPLNVYILCENQHCHGPFRGEPRNYGHYSCNNQQKKAVLIQGNNFFHIPLRYQLSKYLPFIRNTMWNQDLQYESNDPDSVLSLNLTLHADEVVAFNSSSVKIFPIFATINDLRPSARRRYFFLVALFVGTSKPNVNLYLGPVCNEIAELAEIPIQWKSNEGTRRIANFRVSAIIADSPMRAYLRHVRQYNHIFGCDWCLIQATSSNGARVYPNLDSQELQNLKREHRDFTDFTKIIGSDSNPRFRGIIGLSPLLQLPGFNIVDGFAVEPMHCMILGVFRAIINRGWLTVDSNISAHSHSVDKNFFKRELSSRITQIKVPSQFVRAPRSLELMKFWKSNELDSFLTYYFLVSIRGLLRIRHMNHILCLVRLYYLSYRESTPDKIQEIRDLVTEFQIGTGILYGSQLLSYNLHIMSHLADSCLNLGPTCSYSSYPLEDNMGILKNNVRRASNIAPSLIRIFLSKFRFNDIIASRLIYWNLNENEIRDFGCSDDKMSPGVESTLLTKSCTTIPSRQKFADISAAIATSIRQFFRGDQNLSRIQFFESVKIDKRRFSTKDYTKDKKRDDSHIKLEENEFIQVQYIFSFDGIKYFCIGKQMKTKPFTIGFDGFTKKWNFKLEYIHTVVGICDNYVIRQLESNMSQVIYVKSTTFYYTYKNDFIIEPYLMNF